MTIDSRNSTLPIVRVYLLLPWRLVLFRGRLVPDQLDLLEYRDPDVVLKVAPLPFYLAIQLSELLPIVLLLLHPLYRPRSFSRSYSATWPPLALFSPTLTRMSCVPVSCHLAIFEPCLQIRHRLLGVRVSRYSPIDPVCQTVPFRLPCA